MPPVLSVTVGVWVAHRPRHLGPEVWGSALGGGCSGVVNVGAPSIHGGTLVYPSTRTRVLQGTPQGPCLHLHPMPHPLIPCPTPSSHASVSTSALERGEQPPLLQMLPGLWTRPAIRPSSSHIKDPQAMLGVRTPQAMLGCAPQLSPSTRASKSHFCVLASLPSLCFSLCRSRCCRDVPPCARQRPPHCATWQNATPTCCWPRAWRVRCLLRWMARLTQQLQVGYACFGGL